MPISISPNTNVETVVGIPVCFEATATSNFPSEAERCIDLPASGTNWLYSNCVWEKNGGTLNSWDAPATVTIPIHVNQPFSITGSILSFETPASPNKNYFISMGVIPNSDPSECEPTGDQCLFGFFISKYCNDVSGCGFNNGSVILNNWSAYTVAYGATTSWIYNLVNPSDSFRLRSDGTNLWWDHKRSGLWRLGVYTMPVPDTDVFQFYLNGLFDNNRLHDIKTVKGTFQGSIPVTWSAPLGGTLSGTGNNQCFTHGTPGTFQICADTPFDDPVCVDIAVAPLYFNPIGLDCGECVFVNQIVEFESNGGLNGTLQATAGTVIDALTWQAPANDVGEVTITYTIGTSSATCTFQVLDELRITNVEGDILTGLAPGDSFQLEVNNPYLVTWENLDCHNIVNPDGLIFIPPAEAVNCFGAVDCHIRGRVTGLSGVSCFNFVSDPNELEFMGDTLVFGGDTLIFGFSTDATVTGDGAYIDLRIIVDPVYPTPEFGGPQFLKWKPEVPEYRVITNTNEGGCDETYLKNRVAVYKWTVSYDGLSYEEPCPTEPCCDETEGFVGGLSTNLQTAKVLDDFWNFMYGTYGHFTLIEPRTGKKWRNVRFETTMQRDHINWFRTQSRTITLVWVPCCDTDPMGGVCQHSTTVKDIMPPGPPQNLQTTAKSANWIQVTWQKAIDNVGIKGYEIWVNGGIIDIKHHFVYNHTGLESPSAHIYKVRAYDFQGNRSQWTEEVIGTTSDTIFEGIDQVFEGGDEVLEG